MKLEMNVNARARSPRLVIATALVCLASSMVMPAAYADIKGDIQDALWEKSPAEVLEAISSKIEDTNVAERLETYGQLPEAFNKFNPAGLVRRSKAKDREWLVGEMAAIEKQLSETPLSKLKTLIDDIDAQIAALKEKRTKYQGQQVSAPSVKDVSFFFRALGPVRRFVKPTREDASSSIAKIDARIVELEQDSARAMKEFQRVLNEYGANASEADVAAIFTVATGDEDVKVLGAVNSLKRLVVFMESSAQRDLKSAKAYYTVYAMMLAGVVNIQNEQVSRIRDVYMMKVDELIKTANGNIESASKLMKQKGAKVEGLKSDIEVNKTVLMYAAQYRAFLVTKAAATEASSKVAQLRFEEALVRYSTFDAAEALATAIQESQVIIGMIEQFEIPTGIDFSQEKVVEAFKAITLNIKQP